MEKREEGEKERRGGMKMRRGCPGRSLVHLAARPRVTLNCLTSVASRYRFASNYAHVTTRNKYLPIVRSVVHSSSGHAFSTIKLEFKVVRNSFSLIIKLLYAIRNFYMCYK